MSYAREMSWEEDDKPSRCIMYSKNTAKQNFVAA